MAWLQKIIIFCMLWMTLQPALSQTIDPVKAELIATMVAAGVHPDDIALIETNIDQISVPQLVEISRFMSDPREIANPGGFDVSGFGSWNEYNFNRPIGDVLLSILARRDLFLDAARQLNNRALTNMSPEALAALSFSQAYVEEKWDQHPPWEDSSDSLFNWIHTDVLERPNLVKFLTGDSLYQLRTEYWWATYWSLPLNLLGIGKGTDNAEILRGMRPPNANAPRLAGYAYPVGNQLYMQTAETVYWYADYLVYGQGRYGVFESEPLDTGIRFPKASSTLFQPPHESILTSDPEFATYPGLFAFLTASFGPDLRHELIHPETAAFWNVMRFVYAGARQREGGGSPEFPGNGQPSIMALQYALRSLEPVGRPIQDISAFALMTTVYSDSILLDFTNWNKGAQSLIVVPVDASRADGTHRQVSERNKAIFVIEQLGDENITPNATHISGSRGLGFALSTQYEDPTSGDFLPYTAEESQWLVSALVIEAHDYGVEESRMTLCNSPLLKAGYESAVRKSMETMSWNERVATLCS